MAQSVRDIESTIEEVKETLPNPVTSKKFPQLARAINLAIESAKNSTESAEILAKLAKEYPEISRKAQLAADVASNAATFASSVASVGIECTEQEG